jgi:hypothetical protein
MTVGELRKAIEKLPAETKVQISVEANEVWNASELWISGDALLHDPENKAEDKVDIASAGAGRIVVATGDGIVPEA